MTQLLEGGLWINRLAIKRLGCRVKVTSCKLAPTFSSFNKDHKSSISISNIKHPHVIYRTSQSKIISRILHIINPRVIHFLSFKFKYHKSYLISLHFVPHVSPIHKFAPAKCKKANVINYLVQY